MACKSDAEWEGSYTFKGECVAWKDLTKLREKFNQLWDKLKEEDKADTVKYAYSDAEGTNKNANEQLEELADIRGFCSVRFNESGNYDEVYFIITDGDIIRRIDGIPTQYMYINNVPDQVANHGPWVVYLNDPCYGCTGFRFQPYKIDYSRGIRCNDQDIYNIDPDHWVAQCIWPECTDPGVVISDWENYCHFNFDWRASPYWKEKFADVADKLFPKEICAEFGKPCTISRKWCCNEWALAHYTEEYMDHSLCPQNDAAVAAGLPVEQWPYRKRRLKWVSLSVSLSGAVDQEEDNFCCDNSILGGVFQGYVNQKICAIHLQDMWDRIDTMVGGKPLRKCFYNQCQYYEKCEKKYRWIHKESVPMYAGSSSNSPDIMDRRKTCESCDRVSTGSPICACNFNDINAVLNEYLGSTCSCQNKEGEFSGKSLVSFGDVDACDCCVAKCCCDCKCEDGITEADCLKKDCKKNGPKWVGVYEKGESKEDKKMGDAKPCGCFSNEQPDPDPNFPDTDCMTTCGTVAACCIADECSCQMLTKCDCEDKKGSWQGIRTSDDQYGKKGDPKNCYDGDVYKKLACGGTAACCNCGCSEITKCACTEQKGDFKGEGKTCSEFSEVHPKCTGDCGVCSPNDSCQCECCPSEDGCDCPGNCCCCPTDQRPSLSNGKCVCVSSPCPRKSTAAFGAL